MLTAFRISPSAMKRSDFRASSVMFTFSLSMIRLRFILTSSSLNRVKRMTMHLDWMASMILPESLQHRTNLVLSLLPLIIILRACWAPSVMLSASSRIIIFVRFGGRFTFFTANDLIYSLTTSNPRSSDAFSYFTASFSLSPSSILAMHRTVDVLPTPGGPVRIRCGTLPE